MVPFFGPPCRSYRIYVSYICSRHSFDRSVTELRVCLWCRKQFQFLLDGRTIYLVLLLVGIYRDVLHHLQLLSSSSAKTCSAEFV